MKKVLLIGGEHAVGQDMPEWLLIFKAGWSELEGQGKFLVDAAAWEMVEARLSRRGLDIVVDYEHQTISGAKAPAAGWAKKWRYTEGVGIEAKIDWNDEATALLSSLQYRYYSPVFYVRDTDRRLAGVHSVALTNTPKTNNLKPLLAKLGAQPQEDDLMYKEIAVKLGLSEGATLEEILAALDTITGTQAMPAEVVAALGLESSPDLSTVVASIHALKQAPLAMVSKAEFDTLKKTLGVRDATEVVAKASIDGKITPDQQSWAMEYATRDLAGFKTFVSKAPVVIPVAALPGKLAADDQATLDATTLQVSKMMGVSEDDLKKYGTVTQ